MNKTFIRFTSLTPQSGEWTLSRDCLIRYAGFKGIDTTVCGRFIAVLCFTRQKLLSCSGQEKNDLAELSFKQK